MSGETRRLFHSDLAVQTVRALGLLFGFILAKPKGFLIAPEVVQCVLRITCLLTHVSLVVCVRYFDAEFVAL